MKTKFRQHEQRMVAGSTAVIRALRVANSECCQLINDERGATLFVIPTERSDEGSK